MRLDGMVALVSGGGSGIGAAVARRFAAEGAKVVVTGRRAEPLRSVADETGGLAVPGDVTDPAHAPAAVAAAVESFGGLDIVVANAGVGFGGTAGEVDDERWNRTLDVNVTGALRLIRAAIPALIERGGGSIILMSSVAGLVASTDSAAYDTSKAAMIGLARSIAVDYGPRGIRANALCPGWVRTPMGDDEMRDLAERRGLTVDETYARATVHIPLRRVATPEEIARCCLFLASDESSFVTGTVLVADGGGTAVDVGALIWDEEPAT
jgi:NAD(P)-dependent dehydrogenase (short-subunit alcohol dehydrogenase family)